MEQKNKNNDGSQKILQENEEYLNVALRIPKELIPVMKSLCRITDRELDDLCTLLIIDQLSFFHKSEGEIFRYMKNFDTFSKNLSKGITRYYNKNINTL